ncbi:MAG: peptide chain release factor N(5)-glutamine methyltransferase [Alphaproteobacteria bacterium]|nr:peptide chain release factor N(5)-glutamine methyltransferase [Alphaproteobacteria bacterium]
MRSSESTQRNHRSRAEGPQRPLAHGRWLTQVFARSVAELSAIDTRVLLQQIIGVDPRISSIEPTPAQIKKYKSFLVRRAAGEPVAYIIGSREFYGRDFKVSSATLIPRPDSETLIDAAKELLSPDFNGRIVDLGTGSGALLLTLSKEFPHSTGTGIDISKAALRIARANAKSLGVKSTFKFADMRDFTVAKKFDLVIANPPYIKSSDIKKLQTDVKDFEPKAALDGGRDGYDFYRAIAKLDILKPQGIILLEIGAGQASRIEKIFVGANYKLIKSFKDLAGITRVLAFKL